MSFTSSEARWDALVQRRADADGHFVYAVATTHVFCRPSCASRRPRRENVEFFARPDEAKRAGYRACKRCRPEEGDPRAKLIVKACRLLAQADKAARSEDVAAEVGLSPFYFQRLFKKHTGITPQEYRRRALAERAKEELSQSRSVTEAVFAAGYSSSSRFYDGPARELGMKASEARSGARDREVRYAVRRSTLGRVLVAWTEEGVCDVSFGDDDAEVRAALAERFPRATMAEADLPPWVDAVVDLVERGDAKGAAHIPTDIRGTAFQERVWRELRRIPRGETRTYREVAQAIGAPQAVRAVAQACATNHVAVVIPCHRVVRSDGELSGYRWGRARKAELLRREGAGR